ncbi:MAG TPA: malto-oligosyltrehalose trehalohydrolase [Polyangia bacterium]|nr:malto-oligosyltrehalose trehalohydrolase [Polyangia bacterium]
MSAFEEANPATQSTSLNGRRLTVGAEVAPDGVHFRVWAPERKRVSVVIESGPIVDLTREKSGMWSGLGANLKPGVLYRYRLDDDEILLPDPASRFQPKGPHGPSEVIDPGHYAWRDRDWPGAALAGQVIYELHIGTFTAAGTWAGAARRLADLKELGVTMIEVMPVAEFPGGFGWGYDGVQWFAPYHGYGRPDDFRSFVDEAHAAGLAVILDVVYNHFGPDGNYLPAFSPYYLSKEATEWGDALNYDGPNAGPVRQFVMENAAHWIAEYHLDGLRLDATQSIFDRSEEHIVAALTRRARAAAAERQIVVIAENEPQETRLVRPAEQGGFAIDGLWNDDFHHSARVALTGHREAYYTDYRGTAQEFISAAKYGYLFQGQRYHWQKKRRGVSAMGVPARAFVAFLENHDQVANSAGARRLAEVTHPGQLRAMTTLLLLGPWTPLLFQGQEWGSARAFRYFADHHADLAPLVRKGRAEFLAQFPSAASPAIQKDLPDPGAPATFESSRLDWNERQGEKAAWWLALHRDLLGLRASDATVRAVNAGVARLDGAVLGPGCFVLRYFAGGPLGATSVEHDRLLLVNLAADLDLNVAPEPLLAPPGHHKRWTPIFSSEEPRYGGAGTPPLESEDDGWHIPGAAAFLLEAV